MVKSSSLLVGTAAPEMVPVERLLLDPKNPRLAGSGLALDQQEEILKVLWTDRAVNELVDSIATSGYWTHEELFAGKESERLVVFEGNRRLAAVKLLLDENLQGRIGAVGIPRLSDTQKQNLVRLPVIQCRREDVWQFIGFKHVNGPQDWDSIAKAQYIATVHNEYGVSLADIAKTIGDRHDTVGRLYRGLMVLEQAERAGVFDRKDRWNTRFAYSHLWTGLGYSGVQKFLGLSADGGFHSNPVPQSRLPHLRELCVWLYGSRQQNRPPLVRSQNPDLRNLDEVLRSKDGLAALRAGLPLETSLKASHGDKRLLREAMVLAEQKLKESLGLIPTGFAGDSDLVEKAKNISLISESILEEMEARTSEAGRKRKTRRRAGR